MFSGNYCFYHFYSNTNSVAKKDRTFHTFYSHLKISEYQSVRSNAHVVWADSDFGSECKRYYEAQIQFIFLKILCIAVQ